MAPPSCHGWNVPTASLRAMGPGDLPSLLAGSAEVVPAEELERKLSLRRPLRVKLGLDPTAPVVTLGWAVVLHKLRQFQDAGHTAVLIVGDFTAQVGDPSGKTETRPRLSEEEVRGYAERLLDQFWKILDPDRTEVRYNAEWLEPEGMQERLRLTAPRGTNPSRSWGSPTRCSRGWPRSPSRRTSSSAAGTRRSTCWSVAISN